MDRISPGLLEQIEKRRAYVPVKTKLIISQVLALAWTAFSWYVALPWIDELGRLVSYPVALFVVLGIAVIPGYAFAFIFVSLALDRRPGKRVIEHFPAITVLVAAYNEESNIGETIRSIAGQDYPGPLEVILIDDGSQDGTVAAARASGIESLTILKMAVNGGKARALNAGLRIAPESLIITVDADSYLFKDALTNIVARYISDPVGTVAVAGAVFARNSRKNLLTKVQEWDYFHGIAVVKRTQSLYQGTLVAQGAFSLYSKTALEEIGGWPELVGEDIVMSWALLKKGCRIGYAEDAIVFTNVPEKWSQFYHQRRRWARGLIEALKQHPEVLLRPRLNWPFFLLNVLYPFLDAVFLFCFLPGIVAALFGYYFIAGPMTLAVLPLAILNNIAMFVVQRKTFRQLNLGVRRNKMGFLFYAFFYQLVMAPPSVAGYFAEFLNLRKSWGTK
jgi:biofilm PGA synthesis N-glycosyltransferase PgaC